MLFLCYQKPKGHSLMFPSSVHPQPRSPSVKLYASCRFLFRPLALQHFTSLLLVCYYPCLPLTASLTQAGEPAPLSQGWSGASPGIPRGGITKPHMEKRNTVDDTPRELVRLICIAVMLSDPDILPSKADLCSSHFRAKMS